MNGCLDPCQQFIQFTETESVRFIGPESHEGEPVTAFLGNERFLTEIPPGAYANQVNDEPVTANDTWVGNGVRADLDEEMIYQITSAFWDNLDQLTSTAPWAVAITIETAVLPLGEMQLHPGAARYCREVGAITQ